MRHNIDGVIATNTTLDRSLVQGMKHCDETGGLSGRPLQLKSTEIIRMLSAELNGRLPIIGVGGIDSVIAAREKWPPEHRWCRSIPDLFLKVRR